VKAVVAKYLVRERLAHVRVIPKPAEKPAAPPVGKSPAPPAPKKEGK